MKRNLILLLLVSIFTFSVEYSFANTNANEKDKYKITNTNNQEDITPERMNNVVEAIVKTASDNSYLKYVKFIAAIAALVFISATFFKGWVKGESIDFYPMLRPFVITLIILNLNSARIVIDSLIKPFDLITTSLAESKEQEVAECMTKYLKVRWEFTKKSKEVFENAKKESLQDLDFFGYIKHSVGEIAERISNIGDYAFMLFSAIIEGFLYVVQGAVVYLLIIISGVTKALFILIAPIVLALSIFPWFQGGVKTLVCRYVNVMLWLPMARLVGYIVGVISMETYYLPQITKYENFINDPQKILDLGSQLTADGSVSSVFVLMIPIIGTVLYCMVPKLSDYIIDSNGAGAVGAAITGGVTKIASTATAAAGAGSKYIAAKTLLNNSNNSEK